eukprot:XP_017951204.1 PREDICTED: deleted in malignant brain tumors 1 protein-like [Xenopus tropicalis]
MSPPHSLNATEPGSIRLVNGSGRCEGRVEIYYNGTWGTVCDDLWNMNNARVVCRQLHCGEPIAGKIKAFFGSGEERIWMDNVECDGSENALNDCNFHEWGLHDCSHDEDAGVVCSDQAASVYNEDTAKTTSKPVQPVSGTPDKSHYLSPESPQYSPVDHLSGAASIYNEDTAKTTKTSKPVQPASVTPDKSHHLSPESPQHSQVDHPSGAASIYNEDTAKTTKTSKPVQPVSGTPDKSHHLSPESPQHSPVATEPGSIRLVNGGGRCEGRVEIYYNGTWGTVCDDLWNISIARVVCRQLHCGEPIAAKKDAFFGSGERSIWMDNVECDGSENALKDCNFLGWGLHDCSHNEDAGVVCSDHISGAASIYNEDTAKTNKTSKPVQPASGTPDKSPHLSPESPQHSPVDHLNEDTLQSLLGKLNTSDQLSTSPMTSPPHSLNATEPGSIRLVNGGGRCEGRVEIYYNGTWGTVCDDLWNMNNARVVCRQLHCGEPKDAKIKAFFGSGKERIWMDNVECDGSENALNDCNFPGWGLHDCSHNEDAAVVCSDQAASVYNEDTAKTTSKPVLPASGTPDKSHHLSPESPQHSPVATEPGSIRLVNGGGRCEGRVEIYYNGTWGTVCDDLWNMSSARVVCRQLHCGEPKDAKKDAFFGSGEESIWMDNVECDGSENALNDCNFRGWGLHDCSHNEDAGVVCSDQAAFVYNEDTAKTTKTSKPVLPTSRTPDKSHHLSPESSQHSPVDHLSGAASIYNEDTAKTTKTSKPVQPTLGTPDKSHHLSPESPQHSPVDHLSGAASIYNEETAKTTKTSKPVQPTSGTPDKSHHLSPESPQHSPVECNKYRGGECLLFQPLQKMEPLLRFANKKNVGSK